MVAMKFAFALIFNLTPKNFFFRSTLLNFNVANKHFESKNKNFHPPSEIKVVSRHDDEKFKILSFS
jgi:N-acetylneuraminic acid mutarotase